MCFKQQFLSFPCSTNGLGHLDQAVSIKRIGHNGLIKVEYQTHFCGRSGNPVMGFHRPLTVPVVTVCQVIIGIYPKNCFRIGIKLKAMPFYFYIVPMFKLCQSLFELSFTNVAKRTSYIRPDIYLH
ncbi:hypothetical protein D3C87_1574470 [compost metagenome]